MAGAHAKVFIWFLLHSNIDGLENNNILLHLLQKVIGLVLLRIIQKFLGLHSGEQCQFGVFFYGSLNKSSIEYSRVDQGGEYDLLRWWGSVVYINVHQAEGLYGYVRYWGYMRISRLKSKSGT